MTLVMTVFKPEGIFQSVDYRITRGRVVVDDARSKQVVVHAAPVNGGPVMLLGFTGLAELPDRTPMIQWVRETLRGEARTMDEVLQHLESRLTRDIGQSRNWRHPLQMFGAIIEESGRMLSVELCNCLRGEPVRRTFWRNVVEVTQPRFVLTGSGALKVSSADLDLLQAQLSVRPRQWTDHLSLLAAINRRTAATDHGVSPACLATYMMVDEHGSAASRAFTQPQGPALPMPVDHILAGVDLSFMGTHAVENLQRAKLGLPPVEQDQAVLDLSVAPRP